MDPLQDRKAAQPAPAAEAQPSRRARRRLKLAPQSEFREKSRVFMYELSESLCKVLPAHSQHVQNDLAKLLIVFALGASNIQRLMATSQRALYESMDAHIPGDLQVPSNALSIADSTGLPRETVRRKLKELLAGGMVMVDERGGYRLKPGAVQTDELHAAYYASFKAMMAIFEACLEAKLVELE
jgi:DNA-binding transcriptional ArsR family regulator